MLQRFQKTDIDKVKSQYQSDALFAAIEEACRDYIVESQSIVMSSQELFNGVLTILDDLKATPYDYYTKECSHLWQTVFSEYRNLATNADYHEVEDLATIIVWMTMQILSYSDITFYSITVKNSLMECLVMQKGHLRLQRLSPIVAEIEVHKSDLAEWINGYMDNDTFLSDKIQLILQPKRTTKPHRKSEDIPHTLRYQNPNPAQKQKRIQAVMIKMQEWGWIEEPQNANDFFSFFDGIPRHCNLIWKGKNTTILTILMKELIKCPYIVQDKPGCSSESIVKYQFGKTPNHDQSRITPDQELKIKIIMWLLDPNNNYCEMVSNHDEDVLLQDAALIEVLNGNMSIIKDLNPSID